MDLLRRQRRPTSYRPPPTTTPVSYSSPASFPQSSPPSSSNEYEYDDNSHFLYSRSRRRGRSNKDAQTTNTDCEEKEEERDQDWIPQPSENQRGRQRQQQYRGRQHNKVYRTGTRLFDHSVTAEEELLSAVSLSSTSSTAAVSHFSSARLPHNAVVSTATAVADMRTQKIVEKGSSSAVATAAAAAAATAANISSFSSSSLSHNNVDKEADNEPIATYTPFTGWGDYMTSKVNKQQQQIMQRISPATDAREQYPPIFVGISIYVNGFTNPPQMELRDMILRHGGSFQYYLSKSNVTHVIASNLADTKITQLTK